MFFKKEIPIGRIGSIPIFINPGWFIIFALFIYSLSNYFAIQLKTNVFFLPLILAIIATLLLFACGMVHELAHSCLAIKNGIPVEKITLFLFGLGTHIKMENLKRPGQEIKMAIAGPLASLALSGFWYGFGILLIKFGPTSPIALFLVIDYLIFINLILGIFNLVPAFPLDGGRVLRSIIWFLSKNQIRATKIAVNIAIVFSALMIGSIFINFRFIWFAVIAFFIIRAARSELAALIIEKKEVKKLLE